MGEVKRADGVDGVGCCELTVRGGVRGVQDEGAERGVLESESSEWWALRKAEGNVAFKAGQHQTAIKHYTAALMRLQAGDPNPVRAVSRPSTRSGSPAHGR
jgi:hypothetical protein